MHTQEIENIKRKLRAILAKAESTEHDGERDLFLAKAAEIMEAHQLSLYDLGEDDPLGWLECDTRYQAGPMSYKSGVHSALAHYYGCKVVRSSIWIHGPKNSTKGWVLRFAGCESSRLTTELMFPFVWDQVNKQAKGVAQRTGMPLSKAVREVAKALDCRLWSLIRARQAEPAPDHGSCYALVVVDKIKSLVDERFPDLKPGKEKTVSLRASAIEAANGININRQMNTKNTLRIEGRQ